jgi:hypothetical protein
MVQVKLPNITMYGSMKAGSPSRKCPILARIQQRVSIVAARF